VKRINSRPKHESIGIKNFKLNPVFYVDRQFLLCLCLLMSMILLPLSLAQANNFAAWTDSTSNPLFGGSTSGVNRAYYPSVVKVGSVYHIWYGDSVNTRHASSTNIDFSGATFPAPIVTGLLTANPYHPRVLYNASGWNIGGNPYAGPFLMYYTDGATWASTRVAHSVNGNLWTDIGTCNGVHSYSGGVIYNFDVLYEGGTTWKAYADNGGGQIEYYISSDGITWTGTAHNILGALQPWETWFTSPHVIKSGSQYIMYYGSGGPGSNQGIGVAFSNDGQNFTKNSSNPIFSTSGAPSWRNDRTYTPFVIPDGANWTMYYTGRSTAGVYSIGYALPTSLPPTGSITIDSGAATTNSTTVTLALPCSDSTGCSQMCISNTSSCSSWESYSSTKSWKIHLGDGTKTVYAWFRNGIGNENISPYSDSIILDTSVPYAVSTPSGNSTVTFPIGVTVTYDNVVSNCTTTLTVKTTPDHNPPSNYLFINYGYFDISTNCSYSGNITVTFPYEESEIAGQEQNLRLFHWKNNGWEDCTVSVDTVNNTITGRVTSLSDFGIGSLTSSTGANEYMIALIAMLAISSGLFILRRNRRTKSF
jgi:hypothetical protein